LLTQLVWLFALCIPAATVAQPLYRCTENGKTLFTDKPCDGATKPAPPTESTQQKAAPAKPAPPAARVAPGKQAPRRKPAPPETGDVAELYGEWQGPTQFQAAIKGQRVAEAQSVVNMTISIAQEGKIVGAAPDNRCKVEGVAAPSPNRAFLQLDVSFTRCRYPGFNRRFYGTLAYYIKDKNAQMSLQSSNTMIPAQYDVKATMRR
jgi:hypothetical protein